jgi:anaerobic selenocysteine-containing dehydrogenase
MHISHVAYPDHRYDTPSTKVEFFSERARALGLPPLPVYEPLPTSPYPLALRQGRTLTHFHSFYDHGRALPALAKLDPAPCLWISPLDAAVRGLEDGGQIRIFNERGEFQAYAQVTERIPSGTVWMRDGWEGLNRLTSGAPAIPDEAVDIFHFSAGQAAFDAMVEVAPA